MAGATNSVGDGGATAAPDASWIFPQHAWIGWEVKSEATSDEVPVESVRQVGGYLRYIADRRGEPIPSGSLAVLTTPQSRVHPAARAVGEDQAVKVPLTFALDLARCLEQAWRTIRSSVALDSDQAEAGQKIHAALQTNGCLPTQWIAQLADHRLRLDEAD